MATYATGLVRLEILIRICRLSRKKTVAEKLLTQLDSGKILQLMVISSRLDEIVKTASFTQFNAYKLKLCYNRCVQNSIILFFFLLDSNMRI